MRSYGIPKGIISPFVWGYIGNGRWVAVANNGRYATWQEAAYAAGWQGWGGPQGRGKMTVTAVDYESGTVTVSAE